MPDNSQWLKTTAVARLLGVSQRTVFRYIKSGQLRASKIGQWKIAAADIKKFVKKNMHQRISSPFLTIIKPQFKTAVKIPLMGSAVAAGFPSPADDFVEEKLDLNELLVHNAPATFFVRVQGESMIDAGINSGDILIVDRSKAVANNTIVVAVVDGELTVKRIDKNPKGIFLMPENKNDKAFRPIRLARHNDLMIWGVVTSVIHRV